MDIGNQTIVPTAASAGALAYESRLRRPERRRCVLTPPTSLEMTHYPALSLHYLHYNFARVHKTLRVTPAMQAGLSNHVWSLEEIVGLLDRRNAVAA